MSVVKLSPTEESEQSGQEEELLDTLDVIGGFDPPEQLIADMQRPSLPKMSPYETWKLDPTPSNLYAVTRSLKPTIDSVLASMGGQGSPDLAAKARVITGKAVQSYDPAAGTSLATWVSQQLRQMTRDTRKSNNVISVPEGIQLDAYSLYRAETEFEDEHGREPTVVELADKTGISPKRIADVRKRMMPVANEASYTQDGNNGIVGSMPDYSQDAMDYVYNDSDLMDRRVMEYTLGYGGKKPLDNAAIMQKLNLTPVQLSRRKARLALRIRDIMNDLSSL